MKVVSLNVGMPQTEVFQGKAVETGFCKQPVAASVFLGKLNFSGDGQADLRYHGGLDKAVCVYPHEHYAYWEKELKRILPPAAFGENLTVSGMVESDVHVGDIFKVGEAVIQISEPRQPCYKIAGRHDVKDLALRIRNTGYTGFYCRVLEEGYVEPDSEIKPLTIHPARITVSFINDVMKENEYRTEDIQRILAVEELSDSLRETFSKRLEKQIAKFNF